MSEPEALPEPSASTDARATPEVIAERAAELFARKGFSGTSIREIAEAAGVTKPTLYYHFGSKEGLVRHIILEVMSDFARILGEPADHPRSLRETLVTLAKAHLEFAAARPATVALICRLNHQPPGEAWASDLRRLQEEGLVVMQQHFRAASERGEIAARDPETLALSFLGAMLSHTVYRIRQPDSGRRADASSIAYDVVELFLGGARAPGAPDEEVP